MIDEYDIYFRRAGRSDAENAENLSQQQPILGYNKHEIDE